MISQDFKGFLKKKIKFQIKIYFIILSIKKFECDRGNFENIVLIFFCLFILPR